jgi:NADH dehydrogenase FAD-containing subunit
MKRGGKIPIIGCGCSGAPAAKSSETLNPGAMVTVIREEERFIVRRALPRAVVGLATGESIVTPDQSSDRARTL